MLLSSSTTFTQVCIITSQLTKPVLVQSVRWHRKPRWVPMAKSKLFRISPRPVIPVEDRNELMRLHNNYRSQLRAVKMFLRSENNLEKSILSSEINTHEEDLNFEKCMLENDMWNAEIAKARNQRLAIQSEERKAQILNLVSLREQKLLSRLEEAERAVHILKEESKTFITRENLDAAIEECLANVVDYNYAIDIEGNILGGEQQR